MGTMPSDSEEPPVALPVTSDLNESLLPILTSDQNDPIDDANAEGQDWPTGEQQPSSCRDPFFAVLFLIQLGAIVCLALAWGFPSLHGQDVSDASAELSRVDNVGSLFFILLLGASSVGLSSLVLSIMMKFPSTLIQITIIFNVIMSVAVIMVFISQGNFIGAGLILAVGCCYIWAIWDRIPLAACNLKTGLTAVRTNIGVSFVPVLMVCLSLGYAFTWFLAVFGTLNQLQKSASCDDHDEEEDCDSGYNVPVILAFSLTILWTQQVVANVVRVTVAGVVGTWWFSPEDASSMCSKSILDAFTRATTTSFGSICFGSLVVAVVQVLRQVAHSRREERGNSILFCILECLVSLLESLIEYFNKWAFIYVGLYGYSYLDAGKQVMTMFRERGWTTIINDSLVSRVLLWVTLVIGCVNGLVGFLLAKIFPSLLSSIDQENLLWIAFGFGFSIGAFLAGILMSLVASAVDTVVVCYAEAPGCFRTNYPALCQEMEEAWATTFPQGNLGTRGAPEITQI